jgi:hypothetical protein
MWSLACCRRRLRGCWQYFVLVCLQIYKQYSVTPSHASELQSTPQAPELAADSAAPNNGEEQFSSSAEGEPAADSLEDPVEAKALAIPASLPDKSTPPAPPPKEKGPWDLPALMLALIAPVVVAELKRKERKVVNEA